LGANQQHTFEDIKRYLSLPPVMKAPMVGIPFQLYITADDAVIGAVLIEVTEGKEHIITYLSWCLIDAETMYSFMEKLCLSLFYACSKLQHYLLSSPCVVACQADVIRHKLQQPILSGRIGKWAYALIEYDLAYELLKSMKGQVVADFIVEHSIDQNNDKSCNLVSISPWKLFFDSSACREGQGVVIVLILPREAIFEQSVSLEYYCSKHVVAFRDSLFVVLQVADMFQCFDGSLNAHLDKCLEIIDPFDDFAVQHVSTDENTMANENTVSLYAFGIASIRFSIESRKIWFSRKKWMFRFAKPDRPVLSRCIER
jgi:hypothetical protein